MFTTVRRQNPFYPVLSDVFADRFLNDSDWNSSPAVNIIENKDGFRIELAAPGLEKAIFTFTLRSVRWKFLPKKNRLRSKAIDSIARNFRTINLSAVLPCRCMQTRTTSAQVTKRVF